MRRDADGPRRGDCLTPTDPALLDRPLAFIAEDHLRAREVCAALDRIAAGGVPRADDLACAEGFMRDELPLHLMDEEEDLFPLMRRRCRPEDEIPRAIARLTEEHARSRAEAPGVLAVLAGLGRAGARPGAAGRAALAGFARHARRHLILENAVILPLARLRLTARDLETLRLRMRGRRGLDRTTKGCPC